VTSMTRRSIPCDGPPFSDAPGCCRRLGRGRVFERWPAPNACRSITTAAGWIPTIAALFRSLRKARPHHGFQVMSGSGAIGTVDIMRSRIPQDTLPGMGDTGGGRLRSRALDRTATCAVLFGFSTASHGSLTTTTRWRMRQIVRTSVVRPDRQGHRAQNDRGSTFANALDGLRPACSSSTRRPHRSLQCERPSPFGRWRSSRWRPRQDQADRRRAARALKDVVAAAKITRPWAIRASQCRSRARWQALCRHVLPSPGRIGGVLVQGTGRPQPCSFERPEIEAPVGAGHHRQHYQLTPTELRVCSRSWTSAAAGNIRALGIGEGHGEDASASRVRQDRR